MNKNTGFLCWNDDISINYCIVMLPVGKLQLLRATIREFRVGKKSLNLLRASELVGGGLGLETKW
jgi:hypothetical protein